MLDCTCVYLSTLNTGRSNKIEFVSFFQSFGGKIKSTQGLYQLVPLVARNFSETCKNRYSVLIPKVHKIKIPSCTKKVFIYYVALEFNDSN